MDGTSGTVLIVDSRSGEVLRHRTVNDTFPDQVMNVRGLRNGPGKTRRRARRARRKLASGITRIEAREASAVRMNTTRCCTTRIGWRISCTGRWE